MNLLYNFFKYSNVKLRPKDSAPQELDADLIKGFNLYIDNSIHQLCEIYNKSAGSTRSVLYVLLVINILAFMSVIGTNRNNWGSSRIYGKQREITADHKSLDSLTRYFFDEKKKLRNNFFSIKDTNPNFKKIQTKYQLDTEQLRLNLIPKFEKFSDKLLEDANERELLVRNKIENLQTIRAPILGNSFDINNLAIISGMSFIVLLIVIRFT